MSTTDQVREVMPIAEATAVGRCSDELVERAENLFDRYSEAFRASHEKSPLRNVLAVATSPESSPRVVSNFILYQLGRKGANKVWASKVNDVSLAEALITDLMALDDIKKRISQIAEAIADRRMTDQESSKLEMKLIRLFLGYLTRYHTAMAKR